jgi:hypothetical protein
MYYDICPVYVIIIHCVPIYMFICFIINFTHSVCNYTLYNSFRNSNFITFNTLPPTGLQIVIPHHYGDLTPNLSEI